MPVDPAQLSDVLSSIASIGQITESAIALLRQGIRPSYREIKEEADQYAFSAVKDNDPNQIRTLASEMPVDILEVVKRSIDDLHERVNDVLGNKDMPVLEAEQRLESDRRRICWYIVQFSKFRKEIPDVLTKTWDNANCEAKGFKLERRN